MILESTKEKGFKVLVCKLLSISGSLGAFLLINLMKNNNQLNMKKNRKKKKKKENKEEADTV